MALIPIASAGPASAATVTPPDLQIKVPTNLISTGTDASTGHRMLRFTHITWDAGPGPFEIDPTYNSQTGTASFVQAIYNMPSPGSWVLDHTVPLAVTGVRDPPDDYQFPLTSFVLYAANPDGSLGPAVATSPKTDYCITGDAFVGGVPNAPNQTFIPQSNCEDPTKPLGWSVGWGDQYDQTDDGQPIDLTGVPNGTYILRAIADPRHVLAETNNANNVTDTTLQISSSSVTVIGQSNPTITPPSATVTSPADGSTATGTVTLQASASAAPPATITSLQFLLDGQPLGSPITNPPFTMPWVVGSTAPGSHTLSARVTDSTGSTDTAPAVTVTVPSGSGGGPGSLGIDRSVKVNGRGTQTTAAFSTSGPGETLLAFVSADGQGSGGQTATVSGAGLSWSLVRRANTRAGDSEIWRATAAGTLTNVTVKSTLGQSGFDQMLTVVSFANAAGTGASAVASGASGPPTVGLIATASGSYSYAVGNDWDTATSRELGPNQALLSQLLNSSGDTFWVQGTTTPSASVGSAVTLNDSMPTGDQWNLAGVEVVPSTAPPPPPQDLTPPEVSIINPTMNQIVSETIPVTANASDNVAIKSVQFMLDGKALGAPITTAPYTTSWDTTTATAGAHTLTAVATDTSGNTTTASTVTVLVENPQPPMTCFVLQAQVSAHGTGAVTAPAFHTAMPGETILAFVGTDGPAGAAKQTVTVSGGGLSWKLVKRANAQSGDAEVWAATANSILTNAAVKSTPQRGGYDQDLTVIAMEGTTGVGASASASGASGAPGLKLTTSAPTSLIFAVGNDWDRAAARGLPEGWVSLDQWADTRTGDTFWSQYTNQPVAAAGTQVSVGDLSPTNDKWNLVAVELPGAD